MEHIPATGLDALAMTVSWRWGRVSGGTKELDIDPTRLKGSKSCFFFKIVGRGGDEIFGTQMYGLYLRYNVYIHNMNLHFFLHRLDDE